MREAMTYCCIVDAYSTGAKLASYLRKNYGLTLIHIQSSRYIPDVYIDTFDTNAFTLNIIFDNNYQHLIDRLNAFHITGVIAGAETGVILSDMISQTLQLQGNPPKSSHERRNKFLMGEAIKQAGLPHVHQQVISSASEIAGCINELPPLPLVVKPLDSAGSDGVAICHSLEELKVHANLLLGELNKLGFPNLQLLIQERLRGQQYIVNTISLDGRHYVAEIWRDDRIEVPGAGLIYDKEQLVSPGSKEYLTIIEYTFQVLAALDINFGPAHVELFLTPTGPKLIEVSARMQGGISHSALMRCLGASHVSLTAMALYDKERLIRYFEGNTKKHSEIMAVALICLTPGVIKETYFNTTIKTLPTFYKFIKEPVVGDLLLRTVDLFTSPGTLYLIGDSTERLETDYQQIRIWESSHALLAIETDSGMEASC